MRQQFALRLQPPVLTFGNRSAPNRLGESSIGESHLDEAGRSAEATYGKIRLHDSVGWWWLASPLQNQCAIGKPKDKGFQEGKEAVMARIIEFYVPAKFQRREKLIARSQEGKVIVFCAEAKKPA
jgi:hypothetical protein